MLSLPLLCSALIGCTDLTDTLPPPRPDLTITQAGTWCRLVRFTITSDTTVTPDYPDDGCAGSSPGLVARRLVGQPMQWNGATRLLTVPVRIENRSTYSITLPIKVELSPSSGTKKVIIPLGTSNTKIIPLNADSTRGNGTKVWLTGGTGLLDASDTSVVHSLTFQVDTPVVKGELWFVLTGEEVVDTAKPIVPVPAQWPDSFLTVQGTSDSSIYYRNIVFVQFRDTVSGTTIHNFMTQFGATVFGAVAGTETEIAPFYMMTIPDPGGTFHALDSVAVLMRQFSGVDLVALETRTPRWITHGRYPLDGTVTARSSWFSPNDSSTAPWVRIRAPQAWSCETGAYGGTPAKLGVLEVAFDKGQIPADLQGSLSTARVFEVDAASQGALVPNYATYKGHAEAVASMASATGDNGAGIAGMAWKTEMYLLSMSRGTGSSARGHTSTLSGFREALRRADSAGVQVLQIAVDWNVTDTGTVRAVQRALRRFLVGGTPAGQRIVVIAAGDLQKRLSLAQLRAGGPLQALDKGGATAILWAALDLTDSAVVGSRIIPVSATRATSGSITDSSNAFSGVGAVAAPGVLKVVGGTATGSSFASPIVAGLAALLRTFGPGLSGAELAGLIRAGAEADQPNSAGTATAKTAIGSGAAAAIFEIDAFNTLRAYSSGTSGAPVCGLPVRPLTVGGQRLVLIERGAFADTLVPNQQSFYSYLWPREVSVAQGGRAISTTGNVSPDATQTTDVFTLSGGGWSRSTSSGYFMMHYLEKDTVYIRHTRTDSLPGHGRDDLHVRLGATGSEKRVTGNAPTGNIFAVWDTEIPSFSPTGDWISFMWLYATPCGSDNYDHFRRYVVGLRSSTELSQTTTLDWCANANLPNGTEIAGGSAWHPDGVTLGTVKSAIASTHSDEVFRFYSIASGSIAQVGSTTTVSGSYPKGIRFESDPRRIRVAEEFADGSCGVNVRSASAPGTLLGFSIGCDESPVLGPSAVIATEAAAEGASWSRYPSGTIAYLMRSRSVLKR